MAASNEDILAALESVEERATAMYSEAAMLRHEVRVIDERSSRQWWVIGGIVCVMILFGVVIWQNRHTNHVLIECTTPSQGGQVHECYERSQNSQAGAVGSINLTAIFVAQCSLEGTPPVQLEDCVKQKLAQREKGTP